MKTFGLEWLASDHVTQTLARFRAEDEANALPNAEAEFAEACDALGRAARDLADARANWERRSVELDGARDTLVKARARKAAQ